MISAPIQIHHLHKLYTTKKTDGVAIRLQFISTMLSCWLCIYRSMVRSDAKRERKPCARRMWSNITTVRLTMRAQVCAFWCVGTRIYRFDCTLHTSCVQTAVALCWTQFQCAGYIWLTIYGIKHNSFQDLTMNSIARCNIEIPLSFCLMFKMFDICRTLYQMFFVELNYCIHLMWWINNISNEQRDDC